MKYTFSKPFEFEGKVFEEIEYDLEALTGDDIEKAKKEYVASGNFHPLMVADSSFAKFVLARSIKQPVELFGVMPAKDYCALTQAVSNFLMG